MFKKLTFAALTAIGLASGAHAAGGESHVEDFAFSFEGPFGAYDQMQLQRGLKVYTEICSACHGLQYVPIRDLSALGYNEDQVFAYAENFQVWDEELADGDGNETTGTLTATGAITLEDLDLTDTHSASVDSQSSTNGTVLGALSLIAAAGCAVRFPDSRPLLQGALALVGAVTTLASLALRRTPLPQTVHLASLAVGALLGLAIPEGLRAPDPSTRPSGASVTLPDRSTLEPADQAAQGRLAVEGPGWSLEVDPFFKVESRSPDRSWTVLAPRSQRHSTVWQLHARTSDADAVRTH